jgi:hypothetical protein
MASQIFLGTSRPSGIASREYIHAKRNRANHSSLSGKRFDATEDHDSQADQRSLFGLPPRSCIRVHSQEDALKRTKIALALPSL